MHSEVDQHLVRRLEAFSDIVFGFSLAQLGVQLAGVQDAANLRAHLGDFAGFLLAFAVISSFWWSHYRLFRLYFLAQPLDIVLNFVALAAVAVIPYALHLMLSRGNDPLVAVLYAICFGIFFGAAAVMALRGVRARWTHFDEAQRRKGTLSICRLSIMAVVFLGSTALYRFGTEAIELSWLLMVLPLAAARLAIRRRSFAPA